MFKALSLVTISAACIASLQADEVLLTTGDTLTGTIKSMERDGILELDYPFAKAPLAIKADAFHSVTLSSAESIPAVTHKNAIGLVSGDTVAGNILSLSHESLIFENTSMGRIQVPRTAVSSLSFNLSSSQRVYSGPGMRSDWTESDEWVLEDQALISHGAGGIYSDIGLPDDFILRFNYEWEGFPQVNIFFCDPGGDQNSPRDRFRFTITRSGMTLLRESTQGNGLRHNKMAEIYRRMDLLEEKQIGIELRVDRTKRVIFLNINGEEEGMFSDVGGEAAPRGSGMTIHSSSGSGASNFISDIEVLSWDALGSHQRQEKRSSIDKDSLVDSDGQLYTGTIQRIAEEDGRQVVFLDSPFARNGQVMRIPSEHISMLFLALETPPDEHPETDSSHYVLSLHEKGTLRTPEVTITPETATVTHPELGPLTIQRRAIRSITFKATDPND